MITQANGKHQIQLLIGYTGYILATRLLHSDWLFLGYSLAAHWILNGYSLATHWLLTVYSLVTYWLPSP
eukprot:g21301.t1